ncbi:MAG: polyprenyl synthetase family protein [Longimicrobiales bacterium]|nr:polyprenyl synthetase family protein [Longimicrobiales bacterium]
MTREPVDAWIAGARPDIEAALADVIDGAGGGPLADAARYALEAGGKRLRPILCIAAYRALGGNPSAPVYRLATSLELIHTYSLIHDDLPGMDDDPIRRGRPATHVAHGEAVATLAAAALIPLAARTVLDAGRTLGLDDATVRTLVRTLCEAAGGGGMVGGQWLDLEAEGHGITLDELEAIHRRKTGALLAAAPVMGGLAAGADRDTRDALAMYGSALGLAFQIADDILDVTGDTAVLGKTAGRDTELEKATFPSLGGLDAARRRARAEVERALEALDTGGIRSDALAGLARFAAARDR